MKAEAQQARTAAAQAQAEAQQFTLERLLGDYADHLEFMGRKSHADVRSITKLHIVDPWPQVPLPAK